MKKRIAFIAISIMLIVFPYTSCPVRRMHREASNVVKNMTIDQKLGMLLMIGVPTNSMSRSVRSIIYDYQPGGIILFRYNISDKNSTAKFIEDMQDASMKATGFPLFISLDQESGRVIRVVDGATQFPGAMAMGVCDDEDLVKISARILGLQLRQIGINMNLAPVLDVNNNPKNPVINTRSFGSSPVVVSRMGVAYVVGLQGALCIAIGKHFPGHGDTSDDSHFTLPIIPYPLARLMEIELVPFIRTIERGMDGIMTAHIAYPEILHDSTPATLSPFFLTELLRKKLGFEGIVMTDDMEMHAISKNYDIGEAAVKAVQAGADIILISSYGNALKKIRNSLREAVKRGDITVDRLDASVNRIIELKLRYKIMEAVDGKIVRKNHELSKEDLEMLEHAESVNRKMSRMAIYAHGFAEDDNIFMDPKVPLYIITDNAYLRSGIATLCGQRARFIGSSEISTIPVPEVKKEERTNSNKKKEKTDVTLPMVLFHVHDPNESAIRQVAKLCADRNLRLCVLSTGNPFPLAAMEDLPPTIFTFSATKASLDELAECISGSFEPKRKINFELGFPSAKK